jgi:hypothetical protein
MANHGTRTRFNQGCTDGPGGTACDACKKANNDYFKRRNQQKNAEKLGIVTQLPAIKDKSSDNPPVGLTAGPGANEAAVLQELAGLPNAQTRPSLAQGALTMARILDNPLTVAQQTQALRQLRETMAELRKGSERKGRLAAVRQMTQTSPAKTG